MHAFNALNLCCHHADVLQSATHPAAMYGVIEVTDVDDPHQHTDHGNGLGEESAKLVQLLLQGRHLFIRLCHCMPAATPCKGLGRRHSTPSLGTIGFRVIRV